MVSFTPTEEQQDLLDILNRYAITNVRPLAHELDENSQSSPELVDMGWKMGLIPSAIPEELGGFGEMSAITSVLALEELAFGDLSIAMHVMTPSLFAYPIILYGTDAQRATYLEMFMNENFVACTAALLEPGFFFDPNELSTTARVKNDEIVIEGVKAYVPLAEDARYILVYAQNTESGKVEAYIVPRDIEGLEIQKREQLMGLRALPMYRVNFNQVSVPLDARLGGAVGCDYQAILNRSHIALSAMAVGVARASYEYAKDYAKQREQFGRPIAQNQSIAFLLAEMAVEIDATRLMLWEAAWKLDQGQDVTREAVLTKQYADKMVLFVTDGGIQILGGYGFIREYPVERWVRNGRGFPTFTGLAIL